MRPGGSGSIDPAWHACRAAVPARATLLDGAQAGIAAQAPARRPRVLHGLLIPKPTVSCLPDHALRIAPDGRGTNTLLTGERSLYGSNTTARGLAAGQMIGSSPLAHDNGTAYWVNGSTG